MTTPLPSRATALRENLARLDRMSSNVTEASNLEGLRTQLAPRTEQLRAQLEKQALLLDAAIPVPPPPSLVAARKRASGLLEKFSAEPKAAILKRGQAWKAMLGELDDAVLELTTAVVAAWKAHRQTVFAGDTPAAIGTKLAKTKKNRDALEKYQELYTRLRSSFDAPPADRATVERIRELGSQLETAAKDFDFDVPTDVKVFLEAVQSISGAPLSLLTEGVRTWLEENGGAASYRIRSTERV